jgi:hypothetical protein
MMPKISPESIALIRNRQIWGNFDGSIDWGLGQIPELCYTSSTSLRRPAVLQRCGKRRQGHVSVQLAWYAGSRHATSYNTTVPQSWRDGADASFLQSCRGIIKTGHCTIYKHTVPSTRPKLFHYCFNASVHRHRHRNTSQASRLHGLYPRAVDTQTHYCTSSFGPAASSLHEGVTSEP